MLTPSRRRARTTRYIRSHSNTSISHFSFHTNQPNISNILSTLTSNSNQQRLPLPNQNSTSCPITSVAIVGAGGNSGKFMTESLLATGKHTITAITRHESTTPLPAGIHITKVDYNNHAALVSALKGQDALVITLGTNVPADQQSRLIRAAGEAGVKWLLPNEWAADTADEQLCRDVSFFEKLASARREIVELGQSSYIGVACSFWYEWSLAIEPAYGFDFAQKKVTLFDDGETKMSTSTWPQVGRAVAALLSLPIRAEEGKADSSERCLERFRNQMLYISSFTVSQKDMFESVLRVTGDKAEDWTIVHEDSKKRWEAGAEGMKTGDRPSFVRYLYTPIFFPGGAGNFEKTRGTQNELLGLPKEDIDEATKVAIERVKNPGWG